MIANTKLGQKYIFSNRRIFLLLYGIINYYRIVYWSFKKVKSLYDK